MQGIQNQARQGDVLIERVKGFPSTRMSRQNPEMGREVLAHGEVTGHHHSFALSDRIARFRDDGGSGGSYLAIAPGASAKLEHQEHSTIPVAPGIFKVRRQRTYSGGMALRVAD